MPNQSITGCTVMYVFVFLQEHFEVFAKTLITLLRMQTTSRMLQSIYYVGNKFASITVRSNNYNKSPVFKCYLCPFPFSSPVLPQEQYEPPASSPSSVWDYYFLEVCA